MRPARSLLTGTDVLTATTAQLWPCDTCCGRKRATTAQVCDSPGWPRVRETCFSGYHAKQSFPTILEGFRTNVKMFLVTEPLILVLGMLIAVTRSTTLTVQLARFTAWLGRRYARRERAGAR